MPKDSVSHLADGADRRPGDVARADPGWPAFECWFPCAVQHVPYGVGLGINKNGCALAYRLFDSPLRSPRATELRRNVTGRPWASALQHAADSEQPFIKLTLHRRLCAGAGAGHSCYRPTHAYVASTTPARHDRQGKAEWFTQAAREFQFHPSGRHAGFEHDTPRRVAKAARELARKEPHLVRPSHIEHDASARTQGPDVRAAQEGPRLVGR